MSDKIDEAVGGRVREDESPIRPPGKRQQFAVSVSTAAEVYHEIGNALSVLVPKLRLLRQHFKQITELLGEFGRIDPDAPATEVRRGLLRCRKLADSGPGIDRHIKKVAGAFDPCFRELEVVKIASEHLRGGKNAGTVRAPIDAREELEHIVDLFKEHLKEVEGIGIDFVEGWSNKGGKSIEIACTPEEFSYILKNLVRNAVDAINEKRCLGGYKPGEELQIQLGTSRNDGYARITCRDNGIGMNEKLREKIFDPFFTTKSHSKGTGVGLSIVKEIIEKRGGTIKVENPGGETVFVIDLPLHERSGDGK